MLIAAAALAVRLVELDKRPMHGDEANQAFKAHELLASGKYVYDRDDHHGPTLSYFTLPAFWVSGCSSLSDCREATLRTVPVLFGVGLIILLLLTADGLGPVATLAAALLTAVSPAMFFYSRYYIQETLLVFFTFALLGCGWRYVQSSGAALHTLSGPPVGPQAGHCGLRGYCWAVAAGVCLGMLHATKETWVLAALSAAVALGVMLWWQRSWAPVDTPARSYAPGERLPHPSASAGTEGQAAWLARHWLPLSIALLAACATAAMLLSSFGHNWRGPIDSILAYSDYLRRGGTGGLHHNPWYFYLERLLAFRSGKVLWSEGLVAALAVVGGIAAVLGRGLAQPQQCLGRFLALYTLVLVLVYSALPYKTPWCMLSFLHGLILLAGVGVAALLGWLRIRPLQAIAVLLILLGVLQLAKQCYRLNFVFFADARNPHVYAHPVSHLHTDLPPLVEGLFEAASSRADGGGEEPPQTVQLGYVHVVTTENYWPVPWYLRRLPQQSIGYWQDIQAWRTTAAVYPKPFMVLTTSSAQQAVEAALGELGWMKNFFPLASYGLRPGEKLILYVREDVWHGYRQQLARVE